MKQFAAWRAAIRADGVALPAIALHFAAPERSELAETHAQCLKDLEEAESALEVSEFLLCFRLLEKLFAFQNDDNNNKRWGGGSGVEERERRGREEEEDSV